MNKQKIILFSIIWWVLLLIFLVFSLLWWWGNKTKIVVPKEFNIWVVWDETAWYSDIITAFKTRYPDYSTTDIKFTKFSNYADYEKTLLNVMSDGNSPDIFVINNNAINSDWNSLLENKIVWLPDNVVNQDYFEKNFNKIFDELIIQSTEKDSEWKDKKVNYLKWVPMWFEALWVFYNFRKVRNIPTTWSELDKEIIDSAKDDYSTIWIWFWNKYVINSADILTLMFIQNWVKDYKSINNSNSDTSLKAYLSYSTDINNWLSKFIDEMNTLNLTTTDLFVRWKVGMIVWYPSLIKEIILAIKRTWWESSLSEKFLRTAPIFQIWTTDDTSNSDSKNDKVNLVNYNFFALSKFSQNSELWFKFLGFLSTKDAQQKYLDKFSYYLPALKSLEEDRMTQPIEKWFDRTKFSDFAPTDVSLISFYKWLKNEYDLYFNNWLNTITDTKQFLDKAFSYMDCSVNHIIKWIDFDKQCE